MFCRKSLGALYFILMNHLKSFISRQILKKNNLYFLLKYPYCTMFTSAPFRFEKQIIDMYWTKEKTSAFKQRTYIRIHRRHKKEKKRRSFFVIFHILSVSSSTGIVRNKSIAVCLRFE